MNATAKRYTNQLKENRGILSYLFSLGLTIETIDRFSIGLALSSKEESNSLTTHLKACSFTDKRVASNLVTKWEHAGKKGKSPMFSNRIMIPYIENDNVIGFTGRYFADLEDAFLNKSQKGFKVWGLDNMERVPKYKNSSKFNGKDKGDIFYNFDGLNSHTVILFESQMNVQAYTQCVQQIESFKGIDSLPYPLATGGTALTDAQVKLLTDNGVDNVIMAYDGDGAGKASVMGSSVKLLQNFDTVEVLNFPEHNDMKDLLLNTYVMNIVFNKPLQLLEFMAKYLLKEHSAVNVDKELNKIEAELKGSVMAFNDYSMIKLDDTHENNMFNVVLGKLKSFIGETIMKELEDKRLINALEGKGISPKFNRYFKEVHEAKAGFTLKSLVFPNDKDGYYKFNKNFSSNIGEKALTTMRMNKTSILRIFKDGLDFARYFSNPKNKVTDDLIVLNSSSNVALVKELLENSEYKTVCFYGINSTTGDVTTIQLNEICDKCEVKFQDMRKHYPIFKNVVGFMQNDNHATDIYRITKEDDAFNVTKDDEFIKVFMKLGDAKKEIIKLKKIDKENGK